MRVVFVLFAAAAAVSSAVAAATVPVSTAAAPERVVQVTARRFSYEPSFIELEVGMPVIIELTSLDRDHGFNIPDLGVRVDVAAGKTVRVRIVPDKAGTFLFHCDVFCGSGHEEMAGRIVVVPARQARR
jgi:cytochrome c oxidase subunit II